MEQVYEKYILFSSDAQVNKKNVYGLCKYLSTFQNHHRMQISNIVSIFDVVIHPPN